MTVFVIAVAVEATVVVAIDNDDNHDDDDDNNALSLISQHFSLSTSSTPSPF